MILTESSSTSKSAKRRKSDKSDAVEDELLKFMRKKNEETSPAAVKQDSGDPDVSFLMSLLPHLQQLNEDQKLAAKIDILQVFRNAKFDGLTLATYKNVGHRASINMGEQAYSYAEFNPAYPYEHTM